ncbi:AAA family ATPase [Streptomyces sp. NPDC006235]|uniref:AAA family ATPase n=1 Tax=Streptomyces sp. NPDC006235 TaxID=3156736 RepID=UPI0033A8B5A6
MPRSWAQSKLPSGAQTGTAPACSRTSSRSEQKNLTGNATNVSSAARAPLGAAAKRHNMPTIAVVLATPEALCLARQVPRPDNRTRARRHRPRAAQGPGPVPPVAARGGIQRGPFRGEPLPPGAVPSAERGPRRRPRAGRQRRPGQPAAHWAASACWKAVRSSRAAPLQSTWWCRTGSRFGAWNVALHTPHVLQATRTRPALIPRMTPSLPAVIEVVPTTGPFWSSETFWGSRWRRRRSRRRNRRGVCHAPRRLPQAPPGVLLQLLLTRPASSAQRSRPTCCTSDMESVSCTIRGW